MAALPIFLAVFAGIAFGLLRNGRLGSIARARIRHPEFLLVAIACSLFVGLTDQGPSAAIAIVGLIGGLGFAIVNMHLAGMAIIAIGLIANLTTVALNGAMPVRADALVGAEMITPDEIDRVSLTGAREIETNDTILPVLGDTYPVRWTNQVVSLGDIIMLVGLADVIANLMLTRRRRRLPPSAIPSLEALGWAEDLADSTEAEVDLRDGVDLRASLDVSDQADDPSSSTTAKPVQD